MAGFGESCPQKLASVLKEGYGLASVAAHIGYTFKHHDALEDAKAAGYILLAAVQVTGISISDWVLRIRQPLLIAIEATQDLDGILIGEVILLYRR